jgi:hypothetical protein
VPNSTLALLFNPSQQKPSCDYSDTKTLFNIGFYIENPLDNKIKTEFRKWNEDYAEFEWQWYLCKK